MNAFLIPARHGHLEALYDVPKNIKHKDTIAIVCHPHPEFEGTMYNKVAVTAARCFRDMGCKALRFNYRGVMSSTGSYGGGDGEVEDLLDIVKYLMSCNPDYKIILVGFSFGGSVVYKSLSHLQNIASIIMIAPAVSNFPLADYPNPDIPWCVIQGSDDDIVDPKAVYDFCLEKSKPTVTIIKMNGCGHFFHGKLIELKQEIHNYFISRLNNL